jgi:hypothetical protein
MFFIMFLFLGAFFIISNENIRIDNQKDISLFFKEYGQWIDSLIGNGKGVAGYVIKMDWLPGDKNISE